jgi:hypothetical protein
MRFLEAVWAVALHVPLPIRHFLALIAPAVVAVALDHRLRRGR